MPLNEDQIALITTAARKVIDKRLASFPGQNPTVRNAPFHSIFLKPFSEKLRPLQVSDEYLIALASWLHGLSTSLGQSFFEATAFALTGGKKTSYMRPRIKVSQAKNIDDISAYLKNGAKEPSVENEDGLIFNFDPNEETVEAANFSADVLFVRDNEVIAVEMKSVRVNSGEAGGEKRKILRGKAYLKLLYPDKDIKFFIGFPFDPTGTDYLDYDKDRYLKYLVEFDRYFDKNEILLGPELWDYLSGQDNTMKQILEIIEEVVDTFKITNL